MVRQAWDDDAGEAGDRASPETGELRTPVIEVISYSVTVIPVQGRFLQTDPIGSGDDPNLYAYVKDDPVDHVDPTGTTCTGTLLCDSSKGETVDRFSGGGSSAGAGQPNVHQFRDQLAAAGAIAGAIVGGGTGGAGGGAAGATAGLACGPAAVVCSPAGAAAGGAAGAVEGAAAGTVAGGAAGATLGDIIDKGLVLFNEAKGGRPTLGTEGDARRAAQENGWSETSGTSPGGRGKFYKDGQGNLWTRDVDGHNGGAWKKYDRTGTQRLGTYDIELNRIKK